MSAKLLNKIGLHGQFVKLVKYKVIGEGANGEQILGPAIVLVDRPFDNLITTQGLNYLGAQSWDNLYAIQAGTGNTTPSFADTALASYAGGTATASTADAYGMGPVGTYMYRRITRRFAAGAVDGLNLNELAVGHRIATGEIFSRALIKDATDSPITIVLLPDEVLDVAYELRCYFGTDDIVLTGVDIDGVSSTVTMRAHKPSAWTGAGAAKFLGGPFTPQHSNWNVNGNVGAASSQAAATSNASGLADNVTPTMDAYVNNSFERTCTFNLGITQSNFAGGIGAIYVRTFSDAGTFGAEPCWGCWSWGFSPKLNKSATRIATVQVGLSWGRYTP